MPEHAVQLGEDDKIVVVAQARPIFACVALSSAGPESFRVRRDYSVGVCELLHEKVAVTRHNQRKVTVVRIQAFTAWLSLANECRSQALADSERYLVATADLDLEEQKKSSSKLNGLSSQ